MERFDRWGTATAPVSPNAADYIQPWIEKRILAGSLASHGPALAADGTGYFGVWVPTAQVAKFDMDNGAVLGGFITQDFVQCTPALGSGQVYVHTPTNFGSNGRVFAIDPATMDYNWFFTTNAGKVNDFDSASPVVGPDGDVVIPSTNGRAWRLDDVTGNIVWERTGLGGGYHTIAFTRDDMRVLVANGSNLTALWYSDGTVAWNFNAGSEMGAPATAPNGTVIVGSDSGTIYGLNPTTGAILWTRVVLDKVRAAAAFSPAGDVAYLNSYDFRLYAIRVSDGFRLWSFTNDPQWNPSAPSVDANGRIYYRNRTSHFICVSPSGQLIFDKQLGTGRGTITHDAMGRIYSPDEASGWSGLVVISQLPAEIEPENFSVTFGTKLSGNLQSLALPDDDRVIVEVGSLAVEQEPFVKVVAFATAPAKQMHKLKFRFEGSATYNFLPQQIRLWNFVTNAWELVDSRMATVGDSSVTVTVTTNASRFVSQSNREMRAEVAIGTNDAEISTWVGRYDEMHWTLEPVFGT
jgi:outer membrane protein assembly factor BamB